MNQYVTGSTIRALREKNHLTQAELAEKLNVSDKTISKWETGRGFPDITLLEPIAEAFRISVTELLSGETVVNRNVSANLFRSKFYVCPICGNVLQAAGEAVISCHGITLQALEAEEADEAHPIEVSVTENEFYVTVAHEMTRSHHISFLAAVSTDRIQLVKLYPEGGAEARFSISGVRDIYCCCNRDGLYRKRIR